MDNYIKEFPDSPRINEAREILLAAYFNSRNYNAAYEAIRQLPDPDNNVKMALQKIAYFRALGVSRPATTTGRSNCSMWPTPIDIRPKYTALTKFWRAETYVRKGDYAKAQPLYEAYVALSPSNERENRMAQYNLGYCYFNAKQWDKAAARFNSFPERLSRQGRFAGGRFQPVG